MPETPATRALRDAGISFAVREYARAPGRGGFGAAAVTALGADPARVFATLVADVDGVLAVGVVPVPFRLDLTALAAALGGKRAAMADAAVAERRTGYVLGGISPFGQKHPHRTVIDESVRRWDTVFVSGGRRGLELELEPGDLIRASEAIVARIGRRAAPREGGDAADARR